MPQPRRGNSPTSSAARLFQSAHGGDRLVRLSSQGKIIVVLALEGPCLATPYLTGTMLQSLLAYPDHPYDWEPLGYDEDGQFVTVAIPDSLPRGTVREKERFTVDTVRAEVEQGRKCWVYVQNTQKRDVQQRMVQTLQDAGGWCRGRWPGRNQLSRLDNQRDDILRYFPATRTLVSFVCRMNREPIRSIARSVANLEFHHAGEHVNEVARKVVALLERRGIRAVNPSMGFPMETDRFPGGKIWVVSHKPVAVVAGLGYMGIHRNVIHPRFGNFILLGTVMVDAEATAYDQPLAYNPCLECKLCWRHVPLERSPQGSSSQMEQRPLYSIHACYPRSPISSAVH